MGIAFAIAAALIASRFLALVPDDEMSPSYLRGDLLVVLPLAPEVGDVVALADPLDPARWSLRRVETIGGAARYDGQVVRTGAQPKVRLLDMGEFAGKKIRLEGDHLVSRRKSPPAGAAAPERGVPDDAAFLSADARDEAMDSRWWGAVPLPAISGVVVARVGQPTTPWRGWVGGRAEAAVVPKSSRLGPVP